ncbi:hypothetical protein HELRODRAFT_173112 [Helobdella robusta]|uniref:Uncharacterized protein n=1 Tax=Helobdella robusta TaxID=6412 RepID=T1F6D6_HELRO|nr:hypothetical protein HELRODRAFT_173112 [Helobdella robusta]ESO04041.1 hypothetical protein HELRODRAFT_173112 [Helobdella robusta]
MATYCSQLLPRKQSTNTNQIKKHDSDKLNTPFTVATWNAGTLYQIEKFENVEQEMKRMNLSILRLSKTWWKKSGIITFEKGKFIYSGDDSHKRGLGVLLNKELSENLEGFWAVSDKV